MTGNTNRQKTFLFPFGKFDSFMKFNEKLDLKVKLDLKTSY